jgi:hypothetical protein
MGIIILLLRLHRIFKSVTIEINEKTVQEFNQLLDESRNAANQFLDELKYEKNALKDIFLIIEEKERDLKALIDKTKSFVNQETTITPLSQDEFSDENYREILNLARRGFNEEQISQQSGLPEGEIDLILNLSRAKNK